MAFVEPLKSKAAKDVLTAFKKILIRTEVLPKSIYIDSGGEFINKLFLSFCSKNNIKIYQAFTNLHAPVVERLIQTLKVGNTISIELILNNRIE